VPSVEASNTLRLVLGRDTRLVECGMAGMLEACFGEPFVVVHHSITYELDLGYRRDGLEVGVEDGLLGFASLVVSMAVALRLRIECLEIGAKLSSLR